MKKYGWAYWRWFARRCWNSFGWVGRIGLFALISAPLVGWFGMWPLKQQNEDLAQAVQSAQMHGPASNRPSEQTSDHEHVQAFYAWLPDIHSDALGKLMASLQQAANANNLTLDQGEYRLVTTAETDVISYDIQLPVKGSYPRIRRFMAQAQQDNPTLALTSIGFARQAAQEIGLEASIHWVLYLKQNPVPGEHP